MFQNQFLEKAYQSIGGLGRFEILLIAVICTIRNYGSIPLYMFAIATQEYDYLCRFDPTTEFKSCTLDYVCKQKNS